MDTLLSTFVGRPLAILAVAAIVVVAHLLLRTTGTAPRAHPGALLVAAAAWALHAVWE